MSQYYAGVVRKKYTLFCVAPDGSRVEIASCYDENAAKFGKDSSQKVFELMAESFDMDESFEFKIVESMESADDVPLAQLHQDSTVGTAFK